jgi:hypothetical protein
LPAPGSLQVVGSLRIGRDPLVDLGPVVGVVAHGRPYLRSGQRGHLGDDVYPSVHDKAASLLHSLARNRPLVDGNRRLTPAATVAFYGGYGLRLTMSNDEAYDLVMAVAAGRLDDVEPIAERLRSNTAPWR